MRRVTPDDLPQVRAVLEAQVHLAMFPLNNLAHYGLDGDDAYAPRMWISAEGTDVLTVTQNGMVMPFLPSGDYAAAAAVLAGQRVSGVIGRAGWARGLIAAAGIDASAATLDQDEPQFSLVLDNLIVPDGPGELIPLQDAPRDLMIAWRVDYDVEALGTDRAKAAATMPAQVDRTIARDSHRVLMVAGQPVCTTGFNAILPQAVQVGGVYTPPALRGRGHARRAVALHLAQARAQGVQKATLFSASDMASRAYRAIGFERVGDWSLVLLPQEGAHG